MLPQLVLLPPQSKTGGLDSVCTFECPQTNTGLYNIDSLNNSEGMTILGRNDTNTEGMTIIRKE